MTDDGQLIQDASGASYEVRRDLNEDNEGLQVVRLDLGQGHGATESPLSQTNPLPASPPVLTTRVDDVGGDVLYVGEALPGSSEASELWRIKKISGASDITITWAEGNASFNKAWQQRLSYSYS